MCPSLFFCINPFLQKLIFVSFTRANQAHMTKVHPQIWKKQKEAQQEAESGVEIDNKADEVLNDILTGPPTGG